MQMLQPVAGEGSYLAGCEQMLGGAVCEELPPLPCLLATS